MPKPTRFLTIHGHFYQPPRENAWLEEIERQPSASPYHDWNERIDVECYAPNATARILDERDLIKRVVNNYADISFNFGPTLLSWMEVHARATYDAVLLADRTSQEKLGHGSAIAQGYGHAIFPLLDARDKVTQVAWGIADFVHRFGRQPEGMWLPETAVDTATLEVLAAAGIAFTILAPRQARTLRRAGEEEAVPVDESTLDTRVPYRVELPSGRTIAIFFYDGGASQAVAFERLLANGQTFAERLRSRFDERETPQLVSIATDGETYGHHHRFGEMALAWALSAIASSDDVVLTNYAAFLAAHPPEDVVTIAEATAWSCAHGVGRWKESCGCRMRADSDQSWRGPLREALDFVRDRLAPWFEERARAFVDDPWGARDAYIRVVLDRSPASRRAFFDAVSARVPTAEDERVLLTLLETQRNAMLMYTSCGWFFDDIHGIEARQVLEYAVRCCELAVKAGGPDLLPELLTRLAPARAVSDPISGRDVVEKQILPARFDHARYAKQVAVLSLLRPGDEVSSAGYAVRPRATVRERDGGASAAFGDFAVEDVRTGEVQEFGFACAREGLARFVGGIAQTLSDPDPGELAGHFRDGGFDAFARTSSRRYADAIDSMSVLSSGTRERVAVALVEDHMEEIDALYQKLHETASPLLRQLSLLGVDPPRPLRTASKLVLEVSLTDALAEPEPNLDWVDTLLEEARAEGIQLREDEIQRALSRVIDQVADRLASAPEPALVERLTRVVAIARRVSHGPALRHAQDVVWRLALRRPETISASDVERLCALLGVAWPVVA